MEKKEFDDFTKKLIQGLATVETDGELEDYASGVINTSIDVLNKQEYFSMFEKEEILKMIIPMVYMNAGVSMTQEELEEVFEKTKGAFGERKGVPFGGEAV